LAPIPVVYNHKTGSGYRSGADTAVASVFSGGYVDGPADPLYHFGHGLSYTSFQVDGLRTSADEVDTSGSLEVYCDVQNTGVRAGEDVVMLFTNFFGAHVARPVLSLVGFKKVRLEPQERKTIRFDLSMSQLGYYDEEMEFVVEPGDLTLYASDTSKELACSKLVRIVGEKVGVLGRRSYTCPACVVEEEG
jgi:beta-glucosidase